jgi:hypothetical protein
MFYRWRLGFIPRLLRSPIYNGWSDPASTSRYLPPAPSTCPAIGKSTALGWIDQVVICEASLARPLVAPLPLGTTDAPKMLELTAATEWEATSGMRASDGRLAAMAGERLRSQRIRGSRRGVPSSRISRPRIDIGVGQDRRCRNLVYEI